MEWYPPKMKILFLLISCSFFLSSQAQNASQYFADGKLPKKLKEIVNPKFPRKVIKKIKRRNKKGTLRVGVIDSGFDYLHPALIEGFDYKVVDNKVVSVGYDFLSNDRLPYHLEVEVDIFAFGANLNKEGKILNALSDPIKELDDINDFFMKSLLFELEGSPKLMESVFSKINKSNLNVLGATRMLANLQRYLEENSQVEMALAKNKDTFERIVGAEWLIDSKTGLPSIGDLSLDEFFMAFDGSEEFIEVLEKVFIATDKKYGFNQKLSSMHSFRYLNKKIPKESRKNLDSTLEILQTKWFEDKFNYRNHDPMWETVETLKSLMSSKELLAIYSKEVSEDKKKQLLTDVYDKQLNLYEIEINKMISQENDIDVLKSLQLTLLNFKNKKKRLTELFKRRDILDMILNPLSYKMPAGVAEFGEGVFNTYLKKYSFMNSHGTHVSGTVMAQDSKLRVTPLKVGLGERKNASQYNVKLLKPFLEELTAWLSDDIVLDAIYREYSDTLGYDKMPNLGSPKEKKEAVKKIVLFVSQILQSGGYDDLAYFAQSKEISDAIKYVGKNKIKVANLSLGGFSSRLSDGSAPEALRMFRLIYGEFGKYSRAKAIKEHAPGTLFFIAAGNNGKWFDGQSQQTTPTDLSSPFFYESEKRYGRKLINNAIENVITVGSISAESETLSPFTNIPLAANRPFIVSEGEQVVSAVSRSDYASIMSSRKKIVAPISFSDKILRIIGFEPFFSKLNKLAADSRLSFIRDLAVHSKIADAPKDGTSMASPNAAGFAAKKIREKMVKMGLSDKQIYDHEDFAPHRLINQLMYEMKAEYGGRLIISSTPKISGDDVKDYDKKLKTSYSEKSLSSKSCQSLLMSFIRR